MMRLNPRHVPMTRAGLDIERSILIVMGEYELSAGELVSILADLISRFAR